MFSTVKSFTSNLYESLPVMPKITLSSPRDILTKVQKLAIPTIALMAFSSVQTVVAGPWSCAICIVSCTGLLEAPPLYAACLTACGVLCASPVP